MRYVLTGVYDSMTIVCAACSLTSTLIGSDVEAFEEYCLNEGWDSNLDGSPECIFCQQQGNW